MLNDIRSSDPGNLSRGDSLVTHIHNNNGIAAFTRDAGRYLVVLNFGPTTWSNYDVGVEGYYREIANTSWPEYNLSDTPLASRGSEQAFSINSLPIPAYGAVILKREDPSEVTVNFRCLNGYTEWNQNVYAVGSLPELGGWDPALAFKLEPTDYPTWTQSVSLAANTQIEWKCIKRDILTGNK